MKPSELSVRERKVFDACLDGWFMSGEYAAMFDGHRRHFEADSPKSLFRAIDRWFATHEANHGTAHLLVKCVKPA